MTREQPTAKQDQKTNSQSQAGAASQIVLNLIFMTHDGTNWVVQPVVLAEREAGSQEVTPLGSSSASGVVPAGPTTDVGVESQKKSNAQGQGLTVHNVTHIAEELLDAMNLATEQWLENKPSESNES